MIFKNIPHDFSNGGTMTGNLQLSGAQAYIDVPTTHNPSGTTVTIDWDDGNYQVLDLGSASGNVTVSFSNAKAGASYILEVIQAATPRTITWPSGVKWPNGTAPTLTTTNDAVDVICFLAKSDSLFRGSSNLDFR